VGRVEKRRLEALERGKASFAGRPMSVRARIMKELEGLDEYLGSMDKDELEAYWQREDVIEQCAEIEALLNERRPR
jgi:hypothetical protein